MTIKFEDYVFYVDFGESELDIGYFDKYFGVGNLTSWQRFVATLDRYFGEQFIVTSTISTLWWWTVVVVAIFWRHFKILVKRKCVTTAIVINYAKIDESQMS